MKKVVIQVEETIRYEDEIIVVQPQGMSDEEFENALNKAEKKNKTYDGGAKDLASILDDMGIKVESQSFNFPESPRDSELEIIDHNVGECRGI
jgi:hypothetical protein